MMNMNKVREWWRIVRMLPLLAQHVRVLTRKIEDMEKRLSEIEATTDHHQRMVMFNLQVNKDQTACIGKQAEVVGQQTLVIEALVERCARLEAHAFGQKGEVAVAPVIH